MSDTSPAETVSPRPVTPLGIIAANLVKLEERAQALSYVDSQFSTMLRETARLATGLDDYLVESTSPASDMLMGLENDTLQRNWTQLFAEADTTLLLESEMLSGHVEGQFLNLLVHAMRATRILEIGLFTGYSALAMAEALPAEGRLIAFEVDAYAAGIARRWFDESPHGQKIQIEIGPAMESLKRIRDAGDRFDLIFIDADKAQYTAYFDLILESSLLDANGLICVDNTLMQGETYRSPPLTANGLAIAEFNRVVAREPRVQQVLLPLRDGITLIRRTKV